MEGNMMDRDVLGDLAQVLRSAADVLDAACVDGDALTVLDTIRAIAYVGEDSCAAVLCAAAFGYNYEAAVSLVAGLLTSTSNERGPAASIGAQLAATISRAAERSEAAGARVSVGEVIDRVEHETVELTLDDPNGVDRAAPPMMSCGHAANGTTGDGEPVCIICAGIVEGARQVAPEPPSLDGRTMRCSYDNLKAGHGRGYKEPAGSSIRPSDPAAAFFEYRGPGSRNEAEHDAYYCGCYGWD